MRWRNKQKPLVLALTAIIHSTEGQATENEGVKLPEIRINAGKLREPAFKADKSSTGLKFDADIRDIPQSISVVKEELIKSQSAFDLRDALRNVSGLTVAAGEGGRTGDSITLRGFAANSDTYQDGVKENGQYFRDTFFIERAEVLKGASSILFGRGSTGGVINTVSKKPVMGRSFAVADFTYGSFDFKRGSLDAGIQLTDNIAVRLNGLFQDAGSYRDYNFTNRWGLAPSIKFAFNPDTDLVLHLLYQQEDSVYDQGVPTFMGRPADVPRKTYYGFIDDRLQKYETTVVTGIFNHRFTDEFRVRNTFRYGDYNREYRSLLFSAIAGTNTRVNRTQALRESPQQIFFNQTDFSFVKPIAGFKNQLMFGTEIGWEEFSFISKNSTGPASVTNIAIFNPVSASTIGAGRANDFTGKLDTNRIISTQTVAGYVLNQFELSPEWKILAGTRYDVFEARQTDRLTAGVLSNTAHQFSPRAGLVWQPTDRQSYYFSWGTSFNPTAETFNISLANARLDPERNYNYEVGGRIDLFDGRLSATGAIFRLEKTNARTVSQNDPNVNILAGEQRTDGAELGLAGQILPGWNISATYAYLDAEVIKSNTRQNSILTNATGILLQGKRAVNVPEHSGVVWTTYHINPEWEVGGGVYFSTSRYADSLNEVTLPGYARIDLMAAYHHKYFDIQANAFNLFDKVYYDSGQARTALPGAPLSGRISIRFKY